MFAFNSPRVVAPPTCPKTSPVTGLENQFYTWKEGQKIRYQASGPSDGKPVLLVHGLFVNADHWRKTIPALSEQGYRCYAVDLWGCGWSSKPPADSEVAQKCNGENGRFSAPGSDILKGIELGSADGKKTRIVDVELRHPLHSPYNFYSWSELIRDFSKDVILQERKVDETVTLVANSIGTISSLQAIIDQPALFDGCFVVCPNFRELHSAEVPFSSFTMPILRRVQALLRKYGQIAFDALAKPGTVKQILMEPYAVSEAVDDDLVKVLLDPLLTDGASRVVFDSLSYSAGPLPEQQLAALPPEKPVWICYGDKDPWTPGKRVEALARYDAVKRVDLLPGIGHCPHDEAPTVVNPLLFDFLRTVSHAKLEV